MGKGSYLVDMEVISEIMSGRCVLGRARNRAMCADNLLTLEGKCCVRRAVRRW